MRSLLALAAAVLLSGCNSARGEAVIASPVYRATSSGRIDAANESRQLVAAVDGTIAHIFVQRGEHVSRGQRLLDVECDPRVAAVAARAAAADQNFAAANSVEAGARPEEISAANAILASAQSRLSDGNDSLRRALALQTTGFVAQREIESRRNASAGAEADVALATAKLRQLRNGPRASDVASARSRALASAAEARVARALARQCSIESPVDGTVLQILRREGEFSGASQGTPLIIVGDLSHVIVRAEFNERDAADLVLGEAAEIWVEGSKQHWRGHIVQLASIMGRRSARSLDPTDRFDRDVREALIAFDDNAPPNLVGLRVMVGVRI